ncbi:hypothetical protein, partial [Escherichia coli]|uniref:hypothetical protein n=1 Tax=Escherichia coli TaxID=562 RepID=UPI003CC9397E
MGSCAAPSAKGDDKFITTDYLQQCLDEADEGRRRHRPGEQETLHRVATRLPQPRKAVGCFHTLGYHL